MRAEIGGTLDTVEAQAAAVGQRLLGRLVELQWEEIDAQVVARYRARRTPGTVAADGHAPVLVASRFGMLELRRQIYPQRERRDPLLRRLLRALWAGNVPRAVRALVATRRQDADPAAVDTLCAYLDPRAEWIPDYRTRRRHRRYIGSGLGEKANDRIVARRQKRRGMPWGARSNDALAPCARCC